MSARPVANERRRYPSPPAPNASALGIMPATVRMRQARARRKLRAFALTLPLLVFLMLTFLVPIAALLGALVWERRHYVEVVVRSRLHTGGGGTSTPKRAAVIR